MISILINNMAHSGESKKASDHYMKKFVECMKLKEYLENPPLPILGDKENPCVSVEHGSTDNIVVRINNNHYPVIDCISIQPRDTYYSLVLMGKREGYHPDFGVAMHEEIPQHIIDHLGYRCFLDYGIKEDLYTMEDVLKELMKLSYG